jgi:glucosyl-dolichyl phosphate glucuronosyltransferase
MACEVSISIIICTFNRAAELRQTLDSLGKVIVPADWRVMLHVVDNASVDETSEVVRGAEFRNMNVEYLYEPRRGKCNALNAGLAKSRGEIILFTDDDVTFAEDWITQMVSLLLSGCYDAVVGRIELADELQRSWMTWMHKWWLANIEAPYGGSPELIGANSGIRRSVLELVPAFDRELGDAPWGPCAEDSLFSKQLVRAGFRIGFAQKASVVHHPDKARLRRSQWLIAARKRGRSIAYIRHHWEHAEMRALCLRWFYLWAKLWVRRTIQPPPLIESEGCPLWEMSYVMNMEMCRQFSLEIRRPRNYLLRGLTKLNH